MQAVVGVERWDTENVWFQEDGATAHTARRSLGVLKKNVPWAFDLFKGRRGVAGTVTRFKPL